MNKRKLYQRVAVAVFLILPFVLLSLLSRYEPIVRVAVLMTLLPAGSFVMAYYGLSPKTRMIKPGSSFAKSKHNKKIEWTLRIFLASMGGLLFIKASVPLGIDVYNVLFYEEKPQKIVGKVTDNGTPYGLHFLSQSIVFDDNEGIRHRCNLLYSNEPRLRKNKIYTFYILPESKIVTNVEPPGAWGDLD